MYGPSIWYFYNIVKRLFTIMFPLVFLTLSITAQEKVNKRFLSSSKTQKQMGKSSSSTAQEKITENPNSISFSKTLLMGGNTFEFAFNIALQNNEIDLSEVLQQLEDLKTLDYEPPLQDMKSQIVKLIYTLCKNNLKIISPQAQQCITKAETVLQDKLDEINAELAQRIVYPTHYQHTQRGDVTLYDDLLQSGCESQCKEIKSVFTYSEEQYSQIYDKIKTADQTCQENILNTTLKYLEDTRISQKCFLKEHENHPICISMLQDLSLIKDRVTDLADLIYGPSKAYSSEVGALCIACFENVISKAEQGINELYAMPADIKEHSQCRELNPGEIKTVHSDTGLNDSFKVKRELDGSYTIPLNIQFQAGENYDGSTPKISVSQVYMDKAQKCLEQANTKMLGPNGEKLNIALQQPSKEAESCEDTTGTHNITIESSSKNHRSNSDQYASDIDCQTITHEILHLLGLCDEYEETSTGFVVNPATGEYQKAEKSQESENSSFQPAYDCRITKENSIMSNHYKKWRNVFVNRKQDASLLNPEHFYAILYGKCQKKNGLFNQCSQLAYESSLENESCMQKKQECQRRMNASSERARL